MLYQVLGPLEISADERPVVVRGGKQRALLAMLLLNANRVVSVDRLVDALWEHNPPETAPKAVQVYVSQLRKLLGKERLETRPPGYLLRIDGEEFDASRAERLANEGRFHEALALWRGQPLAEFAQDAFARPEIARLEELRLTCLEQRIDADLAARRHAALVGELEALVMEEPLRQRLRGQLMLALYRCGRDAEALDAYRSLHRALVTELGIEPAKELRELQQAILRQDPMLSLPESRAASASSRRCSTVSTVRSADEDASSWS